VEGGIEWALNERPRPGGCHKLDGKQEAFLSLKKLGVFFVSWNFITLRSTVVGWTWWRWSSLFYQSGQCLNRRIPDVEILRREIAAREKERNEKQAAVDWRFTTPDARIKLKRLYHHNPCGEPLYPTQS